MCGVHSRLLASAAVSLRRWRCKRLKDLVGSEDPEGLWGHCLSSRWIGPSVWDGFLRVGGRSDSAWCCGVSVVCVNHRAWCSSVGIVWDCSFGGPILLAIWLLGFIEVWFDGHMCEWDSACVGSDLVEDDVQVVARKEGDQEEQQEHRWPHLPRCCCSPRWWLVGRPELQVVMIFGGRASICWHGQSIFFWKPAWG